ncbi:MAG: FHA domain-containing protein [Verrucomicrobia bacterium]|nr:MAG: FHA domain-containing protein [Verrucomicrobiota bacterium]
MPRITITVPDKMPQPYRFPLDRQVVMVGRGSENDIAIDNGSISVRHAEMVRVEGGYELRDLDSTNGIKLDGHRSDTIGLRHGTVVNLGDAVFDFQLSEEESAQLLREKGLEEMPDSREPEFASATAGRKRAAASSGGGKGFMLFLLVLALALMAFFVGLCIRHYRETDGWLPSAIQAKAKTLKASRVAQTLPTLPATATDPFATPDPAAATPEPAAATTDPAATPDPAATTDPAAVPVPDATAMPEVSVAPEPAAAAPVQ